MEQVTCRLLRDGPSPRQQRLRLHRRPHALADAQGPFRVGAGQQDQELLTPPAPQNVFFAQAGAHARGELAQDGVPDRMPVGVVEAFEVVHVHEEQGARPPLAAGAGDQGIQGGDEGAVVRQAGQRVRRRQRFQPRIGVLKGGVRLLKSGVHSGQRFGLAAVVLQLGLDHQRPGPLLRFFREDLLFQPLEGLVVAESGGVIAQPLADLGQRLEGLEGRPARADGLGQSRPLRQTRPRFVQRPPAPAGSRRWRTGRGRRPSRAGGRGRSPGRGRGSPAPPAGRCVFA